MKYIAIHTPSNDTSNQPSKCFNPQGYKDDNQIADIQSQIHGYNCNVVVFDSKADYDKAMKTIDA